MSAIGASTAGPPVVKFLNPGDSHWGTIVGIRDVQARDFKTREPLSYSDGNPVLTTILTIEKPDKELYRIFVKAGAMRTACATAVVAAKADDVELGGLIKLTYTGEEPATNGGTRKAYKANYKLPDPNWKPPAPEVAPEPDIYEDDYPDEPPF